MPVASLSEHMKMHMLAMVDPRLGVQSPGPAARGRRSPALVLPWPHTFDHEHEHEQAAGPPPPADPGPGPGRPAARAADSDIFTFSPAAVVVKWFFNCCLN